MINEIREVLASIVYTTPDRIVDVNDFEVTEKLKNHIEEVIVITCENVSLEIPIVGNDDNLIELIIKRRFPQMSFQIDRSMLLGILINILQTELNCKIRIKNVNGNYPVDKLKIARYIQPNEKYYLILYRIISDTENIDNDNDDSYEESFSNEAQDDLFTKERQYKIINLVTSYLGLQGNYVIKSGTFENLSDVKLTKISLNDGISFSVYGENAIVINELINFLKSMKYKILNVTTDSVTINNGIYVLGKIRNADSINIVAVFDVYADIYNEYRNLEDISFDNIVNLFKSEQILTKLKNFITKLSELPECDNCNTKDLVDDYLDIIRDENIPEYIRNFFKSKSVEIIEILSGRYDVIDTIINELVNEINRNLIID